MANLEHIQKTLAEEGLAEYEPTTKEDLLDTAKAIGEFALDITPVIGDIKGAIEYEDDMKMARGLWEMGYDEGSITQMGMGAGLAAMATLGLIPVLGMGADVGRAALKPAARAMAREMNEPLGTVAKQVDEPTPSVSEQTEDVFMPEFRKKQIEEAKKLPASERRKFLKEVNRPVPKVFHGAVSMKDTAEHLVEKQDRLTEAFLSDYIDAPTYRLYTDPNTGVIDDINMSREDIIDKQGIGNFGIPVKQADGEVDLVQVAFMEGPNDSISVHPINLDTLEVDEDNVLGTITTSYEVDGKRMFNNVRVAEGLKDISEELSTTVRGETRRDRIVKEGFEPFSDFKGATGMAGPGATGRHHELQNVYALSTSRDPLVSMKPSFAGTDPENLVYSDLPRDATRDLRPIEYSVATDPRSDAYSTGVPDLEPGQIGYSLPKSIHLEAEEAILMPENLTPKALVDNPKLLAKVKEGQKKLQELLDDSAAKDITTYDIDDLSTPVGQKKAYNLLRDKLNKLESLGAYTEQYGARGSYDDVLETLLDDEYKMPHLGKIIFDMPDMMKGNTQIKNNMIGLREVLMRLKQKSMQGELSRTGSSLRNIKDSTLEKAVYRGGKGLSDAEKDKLDEAGVSFYLREDTGLPYADLHLLNYNDLKRILMLSTKKLNKGGLVSRR